MKRNLMVLVGKNGSGRIGEDLSFILFIGAVLFGNILLAAFPIILIVPFIPLDVVFEGKVIVSVNPILRRDTDRLAIARLKNVPAGKP